MEEEAREKGCTGQVYKGLDESVYIYIYVYFIIRGPERERDKSARRPGFKT